MKTVLDFYNFLNEIATFENQEAWDNSGLLVGDFQNEVKKVAVVLDVNFDTMKEAIDKKADLIISHHPLIFKPKKKFTSDSIEYQLAKNNISVISSHTCFDSADDGVNDILCQLLEMKDVEKFETFDTVKPIVRVGKIEKISSEKLAQKIAGILGGKVAFADAKNEIKTLAVCTGSGGDFIGGILKNNIDAYLTGETSYHQMCDAKDNGLTVICAGHFETEKPAMENLSKRLKEKFSDVEIISLDEKCPIKYF